MQLSSSSSFFFLHPKNVSADISITGLCYFLQVYAFSILHHTFMPVLIKKKKTLEYLRSTDTEKTQSCLCHTQTRRGQLLACPANF